MAAHRQPPSRGPRDRAYARQPSLVQARPLPHARRVAAGPMAVPRARDGGARADEPIEASSQPRTARRPIEWRRLLAAALSATIPGLGQAANGRFALAARLLLPTAVVLGVGFLVVRSQPPIRLAATLITPTALQVLAIASLVVLTWRAVAVIQAFFDRRYARRPGLPAAAGLALILGFVALPHAVVHAGIGTVQETFGELFERPAGTATPVGPAAGERLNVLLIGTDWTEGRTATLTDTMMVVSVDPVGETVSMVSLPRDLINVPLGDGDVFGPKLNSLYSWAERHPEILPQGGVRALQDAVGALLGIPIHYYALMDFSGFVEMIDVVGGVDILVTRAFHDPRYNDPQLGQVGFGLDEGWHHLDGVEALAYARSRYAPTDTDFTRAGRQQEILVALKARLLEQGGLLFALPDLLRTFGTMVETDLPTERLPELAAIAEAIGGDDVTRMVIQKPLVRGGRQAPYGSVQFPDVGAIRAAAAGVFSEPGTPPTPWPPKDD